MTTSPECLNTWPHEVSQNLIAQYAYDFFADTGKDSQRVFVLPALHAASEISSLIFKAIGSAALLPKYVTLASWSAEVPKSFRVVDDFQFELDVYQLISRYRSLDGNDLRKLASDIFKLVKELDSARDLGLINPLSGTAKDLRASFTDLERLTGFEARLIRDVWIAYSGLKDGVASAGYAYQYGLSQIAQSKDKLIYVVQYSGMSDIELKFLDALSIANKVKVYRVGTHSPTRSFAAQFLLSAFNPPKKNSAGGKAIDLTRYDGASALSDRIRIVASSNFELQAETIRQSISNWLADGKRNVGVIVFDRKMARRLRALLERSNILVQDEFGWKMSTTAIASVLLSWLELLSNQANVKFLLSFLSAPLVGRLKGAAFFQNTIQSVVKSGRDKAIDFDIRNTPIREVAPDAVRFHRNLVESFAEFDALTECTYFEWINRVRRSLVTIGLYDLAKNDLAGAQLLSLLDQLRSGVSANLARVTFSTWLEWMKFQLESQTFRDAEISSPVIFTSLASSQLRQFDAVVFAGVDDESFPIWSKEHSFFGDGVRSELNLKTKQDRKISDETELLGLLLSTDQVLVSWLSNRGGEENILSPWFELLSLQHMKIFNDDLKRLSQPSSIMGDDYYYLDERDVSGLGTIPEVFVDDREQIQNISVSGYQSLMHCPYQFYFRHVLKIRDQETFGARATKRDYGTVLHAVVEKLHKNYKSFSGCDRSLLINEFCRIADSELDKHISDRVASLGWRRRLHRLADRYIDTQLKRETMGWHIAEIESEYQQELIDESGDMYLFHGRVDRVDEQSAGRKMVLDVKSQSTAKLKNFNRQFDENVQLISYVSLVGADCNDAGFVAVGNDEIDVVTLGEVELTSIISKHVSRLNRSVALIRGGHPLRAHGSESACKFCEVKAICRKEFSW
ncbi:MAG: PD-(D/E)XK nuclease family protein [Betaproteobacteria bacterium]